mmetsp:Transcript_12095/g.27919  ORF Transcript_12095/g.27919 Transcript_12095/m.27919 type:complete len:205 (-) Transcript_12095:323-937(-)|eukprot:CAMPEP_0114548840 /NCGR_PEP_ID=MMETSP0114-20121206/5202_1 /TAXON_ID=31324 /ORGANISM="Goniomonas sp, Strain m" /LENGTH=204 /DNA_ID=CAMNT_0001733469 /DNA_START=58 /DNA_END=672 /DNA_ORIENTATION=-
MQTDHAGSFPFEEPNIGEWDWAFSGEELSHLAALLEGQPAPAPSIPSNPTITIPGSNSMMPGKSSSSSAMAMNFVKPPAMVSSPMSSVDGGKSPINGKRQRENAVSSLSAQDRLERRCRQNREYAQRSRLRKKEYTKYLEQQVLQATEEIMQLKSSNSELQSQLESSNQHSAQAVASRLKTIAFKFSDPKVSEAFSTVLRALNS